MRIGESWKNRHGDTITVTANGLERTPQGKQATNRQSGRDPVAGRMVTSVGLTPMRPDGTGGEIVKRIRTGPRAQAQFAAVTPYFKLSAEKRTEYEARVAGLKAQIATPGLDPALRDRLKQDLAKVQHLLDMDSSPTPDQRPYQEQRVDA